MEWNLDAESVGKLDRDIGECLDVRDGELRGGVFFAAQDAANQDGDFDLEFLFELFVVGGEGNEFDLTDSVFERGLGVELARAFGLGDLEAADDTRDLDLILRLFATASEVCGSGFISQAVAVSTTFMLRSFSRYLSIGWPETKKPRTSFSFCRRVCSSHSATLGSASSLLLEAK